MTPDASDEHLAKKAQLGDRDAFFELYERYLRRVYNRVKSKVPEHDVEDVTQEIFIAVVRSLENYEQRSRFSTWLYTIVSRQIADYYRHRGRKGKPVAGEITVETMANLSSTTEQERADQRLLIRSALASVAEHYQEIILMRLADGLTFAEIAEQRGQSPEAVKSLYRRAIQAVRDHMVRSES
ncbi:MAG: sigma-70 family RNA polymerase sigma factor [Aggregatilineales bacterium]